MTAGRVPAVLFCLALAATARAADERGPYGLMYVDTPDVRLVYFDPTLTYLVPHALRTFTNSLAWQRRVLGWQPWERTTVLLKDFSDYGNASASPLPRNTLRFDIAPVSHAFETYSATERLYSLMNHELIARRDDRHVVRAGRAGGGASSAARCFRSPRTRRRCSTATSPCRASRCRAGTPRARAVFMETWMGGGLGRAQGGYDEMVFRAMVRDGAPLLRSARPRIARHAHRLPGGRQRLPLRHALLHLARLRVYAARRWSRGCGATRTASATTRTSSSTCSACRSSARGRTGSPSSASSRTATSRECASIRSRRTGSSCPTAVGSVSRAYYDEPTERSTAAFDYPGVVAHIGALDIRDGAVRNLADIKGAMLYKVTSLAWTRRAATALLHHRQPRLARPDGARRRHRRGTPCCSRTRASASSCSTAADRSLWGVRHQNGARHAGAHPASVRPSGTRSTPSPTAWCPTTSTSRPTGDCSRRRWAR